MRKTMTKDAIPYGVWAWKLNEIISGMNNEEAYFDSGWLYIWPDGETKQEANEDFGDKESYQELENLFIKVYKAYHRDGLYNVTPDVLDYAHKWDKKLGLAEIQDVKNGKTPDYNDEMEKQILDTLIQNNIKYEEIAEEYDQDAPDKPYKVVYFGGDKDTCQKAFDVLKDKYTTVRIYRDFNGFQLLISNDTFEDEAEVKDCKQVKDNLVLLLNPIAMDKYDEMETPEKNPEELAVKESMQKELTNVMKKVLDPREAKIVKLRFGFNGRPYNYKEIAETFNISMPRVKQIINEAIDKLQQSDYFKGKEIYEFAPLLEDSKEIKDYGTPMWLLLEQIFAEKCIANGMSEDQWRIAREDGFGNNNISDRMLEDIWQRAVDGRKASTEFLRDSNEEKVAREIAGRIMQGSNAELPTTIKKIIIENGGKIKRYDVQETEFTIEWEINGEIHRNNFVLGKNMLNDNILKFANDVAKFVKKTTTNDSLLQEIASAYKRLLKDLNTTEDVVEEFMDKTGLDLSDILYNSKDNWACYEALKKYVQTGEIDNDVKGFDYSNLSKYYQNEPELYKQKHNISTLVQDDDYEIIPVEGEIVEENENDMFEVTDYRHNIGVKNGEDDLVICSTGQAVYPNFRANMESKELQYDDASAIAMNVLLAMGKPINPDNIEWVSMVVQDIMGVCGIEMTFASEEQKRLIYQMSEAAEMARNHGSNRVGTNRNPQLN